MTEWVLAAAFVVVGLATFGKGKELPKGNSVVVVVDVGVRFASTGS